MELGEEFGNRDLRNHVRGCTIHPGSGVAHPGTYRGLAEKLPYLKTLGVTAVELNARPGIQRE